MLTFPIHFSALVLVKDARILLHIGVSEAAMPPMRTPPDAMAVRTLASAAARTAMRRRYPRHAQSIVVPLPIVMDEPLPAEPDGHTIWDDAGVTIRLLCEVPSESIA